MSVAPAIAGILKATATAAAALEGLLADVDQFGSLLRGLGHDTPAGLTMSAVAPKLGALQTSLSRLASASAALDPAGDDVVPQVTAVGEAIVAVCTDLDQLSHTPIPTGLPAPLDSPDFWVDFAGTALAHVVHTVMADQAPKALAILELLGVAELETVDDTGLVVTSPAVIRWADLPRLLSDPVGLIRSAYGWDGAFDQHRLINALTHLAYAFGLAGVPAVPGDAVTTFWDLTAPADQTTVIEQVAFPLVTNDTTGSALIQRLLVLGLLGVPAENRTGPAVGFAATLQAEAGMLSNIEVTDTVSLLLEGDVQGGAAVAVRPGSVGLSTAAGGVLAGRLGATVTAKPATPWVFGDPRGTRLETARIAIGLSLNAATSGQPPEVSVRADGDFVAYLDLSGGDGFVTSLLGSQTHKLPITAGVMWSSATGFHFVGGPPGSSGDGSTSAPHLSTTLPLNLDLAGILKLNSLTLGAGAAGSGGQLTALASGRMSLGPFTVTFKGIGIAASVAAPPGATGNLGPLDAGFGLAGPQAIGLSINAPAISGGGYLDADRAAGHYLGVAELTLFGTVSVKAIGIITTRLSDGSDGYALLLLITAQGFTPVPLGMGFTLTGIGGLVALNRTVDADAVRGGLRDGILDSVLFVKDPVKNADRMVATLEKVFPVAKDRLVVGPLAEISWGSPAIVHLRLALLLDLPMPIRAVVLAALSVTLPKPEAPVVEIHVDAVGMLDLAKGQLALDASLHDSRILSFTLTGDMALRLDWGTNPEFLLSIGGFHPRFTPPPGLRPLNRLALQLTNGTNPLVRFESYLAITSNTLQLGARATVRLEVGGFGVDGGGSFDTLIQWSPFHLEVDVAAWVKITAGGATILSLNLALSVTGPAPWHLTGTAEFHILFISVSVHVDLTLGESSTATAAVDTVEVAGLIWAAVSAPAAWQAVLPADATPGAVIGGSAADTDRVLAHPLSVVSVRQKVAPLGVKVTHVGAHLTKGTATAHALTVAAATGTVATPVTDLFARAQFADVPPEQRLSAPSFETFASGVTLAPAAAASSGPGLSIPAVVDTLDLTSLDTPATVGRPAPAVAGSSTGGRP